ncbi:hypothetical protein BGZ96_002348 [Linnemannia gamsii]|uniref:Uncharacterized protein n=1 Tax=Linnemannia gamsii TaxID=64522 RepID=A0ABQ7K9V1_9FUNG|nr:hypothetical protein BGZ96_002348 [Linnemannia gamsii]
MHSLAAKRVSPPVDPPSFQSFRSMDDPDIPDSIRSLQIHQLSPNERIVYWSDILIFFPQAHIILNGNTLVAPRRDNDLFIIIPVRIEANTAAVYVVVMNQ